MRRRRATAEWFAERLPADVRALGASSDAPAALFAVAALTPTGARLIDDSPEAAMRAAREALWPAWAETQADAGLACEGVPEGVDGPGTPTVPLLFVFAANLQNNA